MNNINGVLSNCMGCTACVTVCPINCISMCSDDEGFAVPRIDEETCKQCGLCNAVCPAIQKNEKAIAQQSNCYVALSLNKQQRKKSASGGIFAALADSFINTYHGTVIGASLCEDLTVRHICVDHLEDIVKLQNSKYVQSDMTGIYEKALTLLNRGEYVLFSGTPCQVAGLKQLIKHKPTFRSHLFTIDIICHGVPSPAFFKRYIQEESSGSQGRIKSLRFRSRNLIFKSPSHFYIIIIMERGLYKIRSHKEDKYYKLFLSGKGFRESCYNCSFAECNRVGDITIGDCDSRGAYPNFHPKEAVSTVIVNSQAGKKLWATAGESIDCTALDLKREAEKNNQLRRPYARPVERTGIYSKMKGMNWAEIDEYLGVEHSIFRRLSTIAQVVLPDSVIKKALHILRG